MMVSYYDFAHNNYHKPAFYTYLQDASESVIRQTGLSREKLKEVLEILYENRIIN